MSSTTTPNPPLLPTFDIGINPPTNPLAVNIGNASRTFMLSGIANTIAAGDGAVLVNGGTGLTSLHLGNGNDSAQLGGALNTIVLGNGNDTIDAGTAQATVSFGASDVQILYDDSLIATLGLSLPIPLATPVSPAQWSNWGWFDCGLNNIGDFNGLNNACASSGNGNIGLFNGNGNGSTQNGNGNIGVLNGNLNGVGNSDPSSGGNNGNGNVGVLNGSGDGDLNTGTKDGTHNGNGNLGLLNGIADGNLNKGNADGRNNGNNNLGGENGVQNGNGAPLAAQPPGPTKTLTLQGGLDTVVAGNGNDTITATAGLSTVKVGNGTDKILLGGSYDVAVAGNGGDSVTGTVDHAAVKLGSGANQVTLTGSGSNVVQTGAGNDVIQLSGTDNWINAGGASCMNIIRGSGGGDTFVSTLAGQGYDQIFNFTLNNGDQLDVSQALCQAGWDGEMSDLHCYLQACAQGGNTWITVASACGTGAPVAELMGVQTTLGQLLAHNSLVLKG